MPPVVSLAPFLCLVFAFVSGCQASCRSASQGAPGTSPSGVAAGSAAQPAPSAPAAPIPRTRPETKEACDACSGLWARHGIRDVETCICRTSDAGRACRDGADCEGQCLVAPDAAFEVADPGPPQKGFYVGRCSDYDTTFGCIRVIAKGAKKRGPKPAEEAARQICVD
jgi:hypothetical protein